MDEISIVLAGIGGYGNIYAGVLFSQAQERRVRLVAGIDPKPEGSAFYEAFVEEGIPIFPDLESFYGQSQKYNPIDLVIVSTAIHLHAPLTCLALAHGAHVLCEKPLCASLEEARRMVEAERQAGKRVAVGYQWSFSAAVQALKADILDGKLGRPVRLKTKVLWPRPVSYYRRNHWAGRIRTDGGDLVLDSPAHNATAHYLHNMLYLLGDAPQASAWPVSLQAERYRANAIENYDAAALRCRMADGVEILFYTAHPVTEEIGPVMHYEFEKAVVEYTARGAPVFSAHFKDGTIRTYGNPGEGEADKLWQTVEAIRGTGEISCGIQAALPQLVCIHGAQESSEINPFPGESLRREGRGSDDYLVWVDGLGKAFEGGYQANVLPGELGEFSWAKAGQEVDLGKLRGLLE